MTKDEIIRMAREAEFQISDVFGPHVGPHPIGPQLERFAELVAAAERDACASVLDANACKCTTIAGPILEANASAIRSRGQHE